MKKWHGNRLRSEDESDEARRERSRKKYAEDQLKIKAWWLNEKLLREQFNLKGTDFEEELLILHEQGFDLRIYNSEVTLKGEKVFIMNKHGFSITKDKKIKAWKM